MSFFSQLTGALTMCSSPDVRPVRTAADPPLGPKEALSLLKDGNKRFVEGRPLANRTNSVIRKELVAQGQAPHTAIVGCADSRAPLAEGSIVGSLEFCTGNLGSRLVLVLGHTKCGAVYGATKTFLDAQGPPKKAGSALQGLLQDQAQEEMGPGADSDAIAAHAALVKCGQAPHSAILGCADLRVPGDTVFDAMPGDLFTPALTLLGAEGSIVGSLEFCTGKLGAQLVLWGTRSAGLAGVAQHSEDLGPGAEEAKLIAHAVKVNVFHSMNFLLKFSEPLRDLVRKGNLHIQGGIYHLKNGPRGDGNERFTVGAPTAGKVHQSMRADLNNMGQAPHTALVGCADSRVLRNAGNTCTHAEGSVLGSLEFCTGALNTRLIFMLGHTACGAIKGATKAFLESKKSGEAKKD
ncbi:mtcA2, partial [Symbiodinium pilosum]